MGKAAGQGWAGGQGAPYCITRPGHVAGKRFGCRVAMHTPRPPGWLQARTLKCCSRVRAGRAAGTLQQVSCSRVKLPARRDNWATLAAGRSIDSSSRSASRGS